MALGRLVLGGELDFCSGEEYGKGKDEILSAIHGKEVYKGERFIQKTCYGTGVAPTSGQFLIDLNPVGPARGRVWNIVKIVAMGSDDHSSAAGVSVSWYTGDDANVNMMQCFYPAQAVPAAQTFTRKVQLMTIDERLFALVYGATAGQQIALVATVHEFKQDEIMTQVL